MSCVFIAGTDTDAGKTFVSRLLLKKFNDLGYKTFAIKPIASGCDLDVDNNLRNSDALILQQEAAIYADYKIINPIAFQQPIAPHIAAANAGLKLSKQFVEKKILSSISNDADINLIEGAGGWCLPLNETELMSEVVSSLKIPVVLVVGMKLGCLNHAILTYKNIKQMQVPFIGWVANCLHPNMLALDENIQTLKSSIEEPCLGVVPYQCDSLRQDSAIIDAQYVFNSIQHSFS